MSKKKREHVTFDQIHKVKKSIPFATANKACPLGKKKKSN